MKKMNKYFFWLIVGLLAGCQGQSVEKKSSNLKSSTTVVLVLADSLGTLTFEIPSRYDTLFSWVNHSDCGKPCDRQMYRYQPKGLPIKNESGFFDLTPPFDSVDQITISHSSWFRRHSSDSGISIGRHKSLEYHSKIQSQNMDLFRDTFFVANGRSFSIYEREKYDSVYGRDVLATTSLSGVEIEFEFKFISRKQAPDIKTYFQNASDIIRTVRLDSLPKK